MSIPVITVGKIVPSSFTYEWLSVDDLLSRYDERLCRKLRSEISKHHTIEIGITIDIDTVSLIVYKTTYQDCIEFLKVFYDIEEL